MWLAGCLPWNLMEDKHIGGCMGYCFVKLSWGNINKHLLTTDMALKTEQRNNSIQL